MSSNFCGYDFTKKWIEPYHVSPSLFVCPWIIIIMIIIITPIIIINTKLNLIVTFIIVIAIIFITLIITNFTRLVLMLLDRWKQILYIYIYIYMYMYIKHKIRGNKVYKNMSEVTINNKGRL